MKQSWRWFGPKDPVTLDDIRQTGAEHIVSALHHIPIGEVWPKQAIQEYKQQIEFSEHSQKLSWSVVESIPVHENIKLARADRDRFIENWIQTMVNLAESDIKVICYNFMPVIDWTRTDLKYQLDNGAYALRFDFDKFMAFDLYILKRPQAENDYTAEQKQRAKRVFDAMNEQQKTALTDNIIAGLPGKMTEGYGLEDFRNKLSDYNNVSREQLADNLSYFLQKVLPVAEKYGVKLAIHPDDPPRDLLGLPRIICTSADLQRFFKRNPSHCNGITLCVGTYGSRADNDLVAMAAEFGERIHFAHLRGVDLDKEDQASFTEGHHLDSDADMVGIIGELLKAEKAGDKEIYVRPDHGHQMMDDMNKQVNPGYSCIGRLKGLAEVRGVIKALSQNS